VVVNRVPLELDEQGWAEMVQLLNETLESALRIQAESEQRQREPGAAIRTELGLLHFRRAASG
jgi:hypothetical protein